MTGGGANQATRLARCLLGELVHQGVREVVLAPGSRSAPLAFEALRLQRAGRIRLHVRIDERSAGFLAVGLAKVRGAPVAVMCTSGTAVANLAPAVVEASYGAVPIVVVSADRPVEARGTGAPQTVDQVDFFGSMVRYFADLGGDRLSDTQDPQAQQRAARTCAGLAVSAALGLPSGSAGWPDRLGPGPGGVAGQRAHAGPVHLNIGFRPPLVPEGDAAGTGTGTGPGTGRRAASAEDLPGGSADSPPRPRRPPLAGCDHRDVREVLGELPARGLVLVGDLASPAPAGPPQWIAELAQTCGWPIVHEPSANLHGAATALGHGVLILGSEQFLSRHTPDLVLSVGSFGLSRPTMDLLRRTRRHVGIELPSVGRELCDPIRSADTVLQGIPLPPARPTGDPSWLATWQWADRVAAEVVSERLIAPPGLSPDQPVRPLTGSAVAARVWADAPDDALLLVAASWSVRQVEAYAGLRTGLRVIGNRGANGIDGLVSTAWGAALAHQAQGGGPALALLGDLAFLHDHNGLAVGRQEPRPDLVLVVADNDGGGIFHQLEQGGAAYEGSFERIFGTPVERDLVAVAEAVGVRATRVRDVDGLSAALVTAQQAGGVRVIVAEVPDRAGEAQLMAAVARDVAGRLAADPG